jgi:hypothetical protein
VVGIMVAEDEIVDVAQAPDKLMFGGGVANDTLTQGTAIQDSLLNEDSELSLLDDSLLSGMMLLLQTVSEYVDLEYLENATVFYRLDSMMMSSGPLGVTRMALCEAFLLFTHVFLFLFLEDISNEMR